MDYPTPQQPTPDHPSAADPAAGAEAVRRAMDPSLTKGEPDGEGEGDTLGPDVSIEQERREIERAAYQRRAASDSSDGDGERDDENL